MKAYDLSISKDFSVTKLEEALWNALAIGLDRFAGKGDDHLMIVIDGLDELKNHDNVKSVMEHMGLLTSKHGRLQAVTLSRTSPKKPGRGKIQPFQIKPDYTREDLRHIAEHALEDYVHYKNLGGHAREIIVEKLIHTAHGNFLWLLLTIYLLRKESSSDAFEKALKVANETPLSLDQTIERMTEACDLAKFDARLSLSWMLVAERPMTLLEIRSLLQVDLQNRNTIQRKTDIGKDLLVALGPLVLIQHELVRIRHPAIREYLQGLQIHGTPALLKPGDTQADFAMRLLAYCKFNLTEHQEPSLKVINKTHVHELFTKYVLLEYAVRYWTNHIQASSMYMERSLQLSSEFKGIFPSSTSMAMLEWACWGPQTSSGESYDLALRVRESVFTEKHECVLQSLIACGTFFRSTSRTAEAGNFFYRASRIGQAVLRKHHTLTVTCATTFLTMTETTTITTRTEFATRKEETLKYVIDVHKHQHGQTHDLVIRYYKMLAKLYVEIHEEQKAEAVCRELREIIISRFGTGSEVSYSHWTPVPGSCQQHAPSTDHLLTCYMQEETGISKQLTIVLKKGDNKTNVVEYETGILEITRGLEVWDIRHIQLTLELALSYEARKELFMAEDLYVTLWRRLTERCHHSGHHHGVEIHIHMIDVALEYVRFLRRGHRHEEACNILICVWTEYEEYDFESETIFLRLKIVGELMRAVSLFSIAVSVFRKCWSWFKVKGKTDHAASCEVLIIETIEEIITITSISTVSTSTTTSTTTSSTTETVVKEVFESRLTSEEVTSETISICKSLISYYMKLEQWSEALEVTRRSLLLIWKFVVSGAGTLALPQHFGTGAIDIAISLAICHQRSYHFHEAEEIYVRIHHACRNSCHIEDGRFVRCYEVLIGFYEEHHHWHKMIEVYQELLIQYRKRLGASHKLTIRTLYLLGSLCCDHGHGHSHEYYEEIITVLNHGSSICHVDALNAMFAMCRVHYESGHWEKLKIACKILWETWRDRHHGHNSFTTDFVEMLYLRYRYVLEHHEACQYSVLRQLTIEYRNTCIKVFTAAAVITIKASIELAQLCMRSETYIHEAISIYEDVLITIKNTTTTTTTTTTTSTISTMTITKVKESLNKAYVSLCSHGSVSITIIERAIIIVRERFESLKITLGWAHTDTLTCLRELVLLQMKLKKQETHTSILRTLVEACIEIIKVEKHSKTLHEAARSLGSTYITCGLSEQGRTMIEDLRLQIITGVTKDKSSFKLDKVIGRVSYVFLVTFEQVIRGQVVSYSEIMADLLMETLLYEAYHRCVKSETDVTVILVHAARLRVFLADHHRKVQKERLEEEAFQKFIKKWTTTIKSREEISRIFYIGLLIELGKQTRDVQIGNAACAASIATVRKLLNKGHTQEAFEVTSCALKLIKHERAFHLLQNVPNGFKLSALMVGRGLEIPLKADTNTKLRESMLELSRNIIHEVLRACKDSNINFVRLRLPELNELAGLLGDQQNFADLEVCSSLISKLEKMRIVIDTYLSGCSISCGRPARYRNNGNQTLSSPLDIGSSRPAISKKTTVLAPYVFARTSATTFVVSGAP